MIVKIDEYVDLVVFQDTNLDEAIQGLTELVEKITTSVEGLVEGSIIFSLESFPYENPQILISYERAATEIEIEVAEIRKNRARLYFEAQERGRNGIRGLGKGTSREGK